MVRHLPQESTLARDMGWWWTDQHELAALDVEVGHAVFTATLAAAGVKKNDLPKQIRLPRPGMTESEPAPATAEPERMTRDQIRAVMMGGGT